MGKDLLKDIGFIVLHGSFQLHTGSLEHKIVQEENYIVIKFNTLRFRNICQQRLTCSLNNGDMLQSVEVGVLSDKSDNVPAFCYSMVAMFGTTFVFHEYD